VIVPYRTSSTLLPIIQRVVRPGTTIVSDEWLAYENISNRLGFEHFTVCHKVNFVNVKNLKFTLNVESYWNS
jgi:hypothetical protein